MYTLDFGPRIVVWYDRSLKYLWVATYKDAVGNQIGDAGYGPTKQDAIEDLKYQNRNLQTETN